MTPTFLTWSLDLFTRAGFSRIDLASLMEVHESTARRWMLRQMGFKSKGNERKWRELSYATCRALENGKLPFWAISEGPDRQKALHRIIDLHR